ncbi:condensation domain-containing protein [Micromonospora sp. NPDC049559]|uniref:condensation domain-containing protein n=1 Tax=Micromonospora sp. NPDC049559 TaxID=3155923 RepID=UPI00342C5494
MPTPTASLREVEEQITAICREILDRPDLSQDADFFRSGGDSLAAMRLIGRLHRCYGVQLAMADLLDAPTVAGMTQLVRSIRPPQTAADVELSATASTSTSVLPLSPDQARRLNIEDQRSALSQPPQGHNVAVGLVVRGELDLAVLDRSLTTVARHHEALRVQFLKKDDGTWTQRIAAPRDVATEMMNSPAAHVGIPSLLPEVRRAALRPLALADGLLMRSQCWQVDHHTSIVLLLFDHTVVDGVSVGILLNDLGALYGNGGKPVDTCSDNESGHYRRYLQEEQSWLTSDTAGAVTSYWAKELRGNSPFWPATLEWSRPENVASTHSGAIHLSFADDLTGRLDEVVTGSTLTRANVMLAMTMLALARHGREQRVGVIVPFANREMLEADRLVADTANCVPVAVTVPACGTLRRFAGEVSRVAYRALAYQRMSASEIARRLCPPDFAGLPRRPYVLFNFMQGDATDELKPLNLSGLSVESLAIGTGIANAPLAIRIQEHQGGLDVVVTYAREMLSDDVALAVVGILTEIVEGFIACPDVRLEDLPC